jgi:hypothetical protein
MLSFTLAAKVLSVNRPRRGARDGQVKIAFEKFSLPTGEAVTVRPLLKPPSRGKAAAEAAAPGEAASVFITAGIPLLALPFLKGEEQVVLAGTIEIVYLNGPLSISRQDATVLQAATASGYAYVYVGEGVTGRRKDLSVPQIFCGKRVMGGSFGILQLELSPGTYWFTTDDEKDHPARIDVLASRECFIGRNRHGLLAKEIHVD